MPGSEFWRDPVLCLLAAASFVSWVIMLNRILALWQGRIADRAYLAGQPRADAPLTKIMGACKSAAGLEWERLLTVVDEAVTEQRSRLDTWLPLLGVIGTTAPYVGLFGTVIGIIRAFKAIEAANNMSPSVVSGGIAMALIATAAGLAVAIPAVAAHHLLSAAIVRRVGEWERAAVAWLASGDEERMDSTSSG